MNKYCYHFINGLKGASELNQPQPIQQQQQFKQQSTLSFENNQVALIAKTLELCRLFVEKNPQQNFQQSQQQDILSKIDKSLQIISDKSNKDKDKDKTISDDDNSSFGNKFQQEQGEQKLKGASSRNNNICSYTKKQNLKNILNCFSLS